MPLCSLIKQDYLLYIVVNDYHDKNNFTLNDIKIQIIEPDNCYNSYHIISSKHELWDSDFNIKSIDNYELLIQQLIIYLLKTTKITKLQFDKILSTNMLNNLSLFFNKDLILKLINKPYNEIIKIHFVNDNYLQIKFIKHEMTAKFIVTKITTTQQKFVKLAKPSYKFTLLFEHKLLNEIANKYLSEIINEQQFFEIIQIINNCIDI